MENKIDIKLVVVIDCNAGKYSFFIIYMIIISRRNIRQEIDLLKTKCDSEIQLRNCVFSACKTKKKTF